MVQTIDKSRKIVRFCRFITGTSGLVMVLGTAGFLLKVRVRFFMLVRFTFRLCFQFLIREISYL